jgi:hypothetical protein
MNPKEFLEEINKMPLEEDLKVDKLNLDTHLEQQATLFMKYCKPLNEATLYKDDCKREIEYSIADIGKQIRLNPKKFGVEKITEGSITEIINTTKEIVDLQSELIEWNNIEKYLAFTKEALNQKKDSLLKLVQLYSDGYYSVTNLVEKIDKVVPQISLKRKDEASEVMAKRLNRKKVE